MAHLIGRRVVYSCPASLSRRASILGAAAAAASPVSTASTIPPASRMIIGTTRHRHNRNRHRQLPHHYYHSATSPPPPDFSPTEEAILSAALRHVPASGFGRDALVRGARDAGYLDVSANLFPQGAFDLIRYHLVTQRRQLGSRVDFGGLEAEGSVAKEKGKTKGGSMTTADRIALLAWTRLRANTGSGGGVDIVARWAEALAVMAQPSYAPAALAELARLADEICHLAETCGGGADASADASAAAAADNVDVSFGWYTRRAALAAAYASSELFMTRDSSAGYADTRRFLERRLGEVQAAGSAVGDAGEWAGFSAGALVNVLRSKGVRI